VREGGNSNGPAEPLCTPSPMRFLICKNMVYKDKNWFTPEVEVEFIETYYGKIKSS